MVRGAWAVACAFFLTTAAHAQDTIRLGSEVYHLSQPAVDGKPAVGPIVAPAVETATTAAQLYNYCSASSHTGFESEGTSLLFLHRDIRAESPQINLVLTHGIDHKSGLNPAACGPCVMPANDCFETGTQGNGGVRMTITGVPAGAFVAEADDSQNEFWRDAPGTFKGKWSYGSNTDGGAIGGITLGKDPWRICLAHTSPMTGDMEDWEYFFASGDNLALDPDRELCIDYIPPSVPGTVEGFEGAPLTMCGSVGDQDDPSVDVAWDWGDGSETTATVPTNTTFCETHVFATSETFDVTLSAGPDLSATVPAVIANIAPIVDAGGPWFVDEGAPLELTVEVDDPGTEDFTFHWDFDDGANSGAGPAVTHAWRDDDVYEVTVTVDDGDGAVEADTTVAVQNLPPAITSTPPLDAVQGTAWTYQATASDPGADDTFTWDLRGAPAGMELSPAGLLSWTPGPEHAEEVNAVELVVLDDDGAESTAQTFTVTVPGTCLDGRANQDETDTDCGGVCGGCLNDAACLLDGDCVSLLCTDSACTSVCGDALVSPTYEDCDDGTGTGGDGCATCAVEDGWTCLDSPSLCTEVCGDGRIVGAETCDDGATTASDGCSATCLLEPGWLCGEAAPTTCVRDTDEDGLPDSADNCAGAANVGQADLDLDGLGDACDPDDDDDGLVDEDELLVETDPRSIDSDGDGIADWDELTDPQAPEDTDGDGLVDALDLDSDGDGLPDAEEAGDPSPETPPTDTDGDGLPDFQDADSDDDGVADGQDNCVLVDNTDQADLDDNGTGDACDDDLDGDGVINAEDNCEELGNGEQADLDGNGVGDPCEQPEPYLAGGGCACDSAPLAPLWLLLPVALLLRRRGAPGANEDRV